MSSEKRAGFVVQLETVAEETDVERHQLSANGNVFMPLTDSSDGNLDEAYLHLAPCTPTLTNEQFLITEVQYYSENGDGTGDYTDEPVKESTVFKEPLTSTEDLVQADLGAGDGFEIDFMNSSIENDLNSDQDDKEDQDHDVTGKAQYLELCQEMGVHPVSRFVRHIKNDHISLPYYGLGQGAIKPITIVLRNSLTLEKLDLTENQIDEEGTQFISKMLEENDFITDLNLSYNQIGSVGVNHIANMLCHNTGLRHLNLSGNNLEDDVIETLMEALERNKYLEEINLSKNKFSEKGGQIFGPALSANDSLQILDLSWNYIRLKGGISIAKGLKENVRLKVCCLAYNGLGEDGGLAMAEALCHNSVLRELDLTGNRISEGCISHIAKALLVNESLQILRMGKNPIMTAGAISLATAINSNENCAITLFDLTDIAVEYEFLRIITDIKSKRGDFQVNYGYVLRSGNTAQDYGKDAIDFDPNAEPTSHPLIILQENVVIRDQKLMEALKKCDKEGTYNLSPESFITVIKDLKIPVDTVKLTETLQSIANRGSGKIYFGGSTDEKIISH